MKKIIALAISALLIFTTLGILAVAEGEPETFEFDILAVDTTITAENGLILTSEDALAASSTGWTVIIPCSKVGDNKYVAKTAAIAPTGTVQTIEMEEGDIIIAIHSSTSDVTQIDTYPNCEQKVAAEKVTAGSTFELVGIDLTAKTSTDGKAIVTYATVAEESTPEESIANESTVDESVADESAADESIADESDESAVSEAESSDESAPAETNGGLDTTIIIIAIAAVVVIAVIVVVATKKKK
ncbi:MAG: hypothetical protein A2Y17_11460 [Clostridiales bacterium GWF2_38_85]|nr:MAG: hypothetical protein A2Y17_11460 [Clostridiales bacterium GWF2_38_85]HBL85090.1 hypothetical protein [Clostridiales bacterium]